MSSTDRRLARTLELLREHLRREEEAPVAPFTTPEELRARIPVALPVEGIDDDTLFTRLESLVEATPRTTTRRFFNQLFSGRDDFGTIGEILAAFLNSSMYTFKAAGPQVILERELIGHMGRKIGYPDADGTFVPGGSMANLTAMLLARDRARPMSRNEGVDGARLVFYASTCCHYSVPKAAGILGIGRDQLRRIAVDERGRMRPDALREAITLDLEAGHQPFLVMATAGTTVRGAYDPLERLADIAREFGLWLHVDGAMGASALMSETHRKLLAGGERADSFAWDAHKLMGLPLSCSAILVREKGPLRASLSEQATYLFQNDNDDYDLGQSSLQCGRRNDALKLWAAWQHWGDRGFGEKIDHLFDLARHAEQIIKDSPELELACPVESITVCFTVRGFDSEELCEVLRQESKALVGYSMVGGERVIRLALPNSSMTAADIEAFFAGLADVCNTLRAGRSLAGGED